VCGGGGGAWCQIGDIPVWQCWFLCVVFHGGTVNWLPGSAIMVKIHTYKQKQLTCLLHVQFLHVICVDLLPTGC